MTATCHQLGLEANLESISAEVAYLAEIIRGNDLVAPVPTCPGWTLRDLVEHIGLVHRWASNHITILSPERIPSSEMEFGIPGEAKEFGDWLLAGREILSEAVLGADQDADMWAWGSDKHVRFWPRRMLHETTVHRADAEFALGIRPVVATPVALDGVDEFLDNLPHARRFASNVTKLRGDGETLSLRAPGADWMITLEPEGFTWRHPTGEASASVSASVDATPEDLLLFAYGRRKPGDGVVTAGSDDVLGLWIDNSSI